MDAEAELTDNKHNDDDNNHNDDNANNSNNDNDNDNSDNVNILASKAAEDAGNLPRSLMKQMEDNQRQAENITYIYIYTYVYV